MPVKDLSVNFGAICAVDNADELTCARASSGVADLTPPAQRRFSRVSVGVDFACGVLATTGSVECWGDPGDAADDCIDNPPAGQLQAPLGAFVALHSSGYTTCGLDGSGIVKCWGAGEGADDPEALCAGARYNYGQAAPVAGLFRSVRVGYNHTCGVTVQGTIACWGAGTTDECALDVGVNCRQSLPPPGTFEQVAVGRTHSCAMTAEHKVKCWGNNGQGTEASPGGRTEPPAVFQ